MKNTLNFLKLSILPLLLIGLTECNTPKTESIKSDSPAREINPVSINGRPRFIIGNYHNANDLGELKILAESGFNLVRCAPDSSALDMIKDAGLKAWINTGQAIDFSKNKNKRKEKLVELVQKFKDHSALAVWEVPDEILWNLGYPKFEDLFYGLHGNEWSKERQDSIKNVLSVKISEKAKGIAEGCEVLKKMDTIHPVWMNHAPRNTLDQLRLFSEAVDIIGCDIYPGYKGVNGHNELHNYRMSSVGGYTDIMQNAAPHKPIMMVLPAFSWDQLKLKNPNRNNMDPKKFPTYKQSRFMAWDAILHGAKGILYFGSFMVSPKSLFWYSILGVTKEIATLEPFLLEKEMKEKIKIEPIQFTSAVKTRYAYTLRKHNDDYLLVAMQEDLSQYLDVSGLDFLEGKTLYELTTDRSYVVKNSKIRIGLGLEPHVLCTSKQYDVVHEYQFPIHWDKKENFPLNEIK